MADNKEIVQKNIETKTKELVLLKSKILAEGEAAKKEEFEIQKAKLEDEIKVLNEQLDELKKLETSTTVDKTKEETKILKDDIEVKNDWTYELMKDSKMHTKLLAVLWSEDKVEIFALEIDQVVRKFLDQELEWFSNSIKNSMSVGIQFSMMESLTKQWADWSTEFFSAFSSTKSNNAGDAFKWLYKAFGKLWSASEFYVLANKVQNLTWYLSDKKNIITESKNIPELMNPYKFKELLAQKTWSTQTQIDKLDINKVLTLDSTTGVELSEDEKAKFKKIVDNDNMPITKKTIESIQKSLKTADKLLDSRGKLNTNATELVDKIASFLNIDIPFFWNLGELMEMDFPTDILGERKDGGVMNFVLWVLGFRGGLNGLHRKYIQEKLDDLDIDNDFISATYTSFQAKADATITNDLDTGTWKTCALVGDTPAMETTMKAKIPADYIGLKKSIVDNLDTATLNPIMVAKFAPDAVIADGDTNVVDIKTLTDKEAFVDEYLKYIIPVLADPTKKFITSKNTNKESFALAAIGGLIGDKYFIEWINIWLLKVEDYINKKVPTTPDSPETPTEWNLEVINGKIDFSDWGFTDIQKTNINYLIEEMKKKDITNPYTQVGMLSVISKECNFIPKSESMSYSKERLPEVWGVFSKTGNRVDKGQGQYNYNDLATQYTQNAEKLANFVYGQKPDGMRKNAYGNTNVGDGWKYRGRGFNQITFKGTYEKIGNKIGVDLISNPDLLNTPEIAAKAALVFFSKGKDPSAFPQFTNKTDAAIFFADINAGGYSDSDSHRDSAVAAAQNFDVVEKNVA